MKQFKVCMVGAYAVGKTSLVARFVSGTFSDRYLTTVGVKIDRKDVTVDDELVRLVLWDINGEDRFLRVQPAQLRGAHGCLLVVDPTRPETLDTAVELRERLLGHKGAPATLGLMNKHDLLDAWAFGEGEFQARLPDVDVLPTSAKTGVRVEQAFSELARRCLARAD